MDWKSFGPVNSSLTGNTIKLPVNDAYILVGGGYMPEHGSYIHLHEIFRLQNFCSTRIATHFKSVLSRHDFPRHLVLIPGNERELPLLKQPGSPQLEHETALR